MRLLQTVVLSLLLALLLLVTVLDIVRLNGHMAWSLTPLCFALLSAPLVAVGTDLSSRIHDRRLRVGAGPVCSQSPGRTCFGVRCTAVHRQLRKTWRCHPLPEAPVSALRPHPII